MSAIVAFVARESGRPYGPALGHKGVCRTIEDALRAIRAGSVTGKAVLTVG